MRRRGRFTGLIAVAAAIAAVLVGVTSALAAFVPGNPGGVNETQVRTALDRGHAYLLTQQQPTGCWTSGVTAGVTALTILALVNSKPGGYANLDAATQMAVNRGASCLVGFQFPSGQFNEPGLELWTYSTSTAIWALSSLPGPTYDANIANGRSWLLANQCNQAPTGRADQGGYQDNGGWNYEGGCGNGFVEHSNSSFALQGLEATGGIPPAIKDLAQGFWICLQRQQPYPATGTCSNGGGPNDGGYIYSHAFGKGGTQTSATGSGSFSLSLTGLAHSDPRVLATIQYLDASIAQNPCENFTHTTDSLAAGWFPSNTLRHYSVWANFKAHELAGIPDSLSDPTNYYYKLADCLVNENIA